MEITVSLLPALVEYVLMFCSEEEEPDEIPFTLTLKKKGSGPNSPAPGLIAPVNGAS